MADGDAPDFWNHRRNTLCVHFRVVTDDLDGILVGTNRTIRAISPKNAALTSAARIDILADRNREMGHVIVDANSKVMETFPLR